MKSCMDCRHYKPYAALADDALKDKYAVCGSPRSPHSGTHNLVVEHRRDGFVMAWINNTCGKRARWFEPKKPAHPPYDDLPDVQSPYVPRRATHRPPPPFIIGYVPSGDSWVKQAFAGNHEVPNITPEDAEQWQRDFDDFKRKAGVY